MIELGLESSFSATQANVFIGTSEAFKFFFFLILWKLLYKIDLV